MGDTAVWVLELEDSVFNDINGLQKSTTETSASPVWELSAGGFPWNDGIFLEQLVPKSDELPPLGISPTALYTDNQVELPVSPLETAENLQAIPDDFFVSLTKQEASVVDATRISETDECRILFESEDKSMDFVDCNPYVGDSSPDSNRADDSDSSATRRKRRRYEEEPSANPNMERSRRNAVIAKRNRERKKQLLETLQTSVQELTTENTRLNEENSQLRRKVATLENEMFKLKNALMRTSCLSSFFTSLKNGENLGLAPKAFQQN